MKENKKILIIEDDQEINQLLRVILIKDGYGVVSAYSGTEGLLQLRTDTYDLILLDLMLPGMSGEDFLEQVRKESKIPVIVVSAKIDMDHKVHLLRSGADDYITKPFNSKEVLARAEVQLRKNTASGSKPKCKTWRSMEVHPEKRMVKVEGREIKVTIAEFDILLLLIENPERSFSKKEIYESVWEGTYYGDDNTISVHVSNLRRKIAAQTPDEYIKTVWGVGFMLV